MWTHRFCRQAIKFYCRQNCMSHMILSFFFSFLTIITLSPLRSDIVPLWAPQLTRDKWHTSIHTYCMWPWMWLLTAYTLNKYIKATLFFLFLTIFSNFAQPMRQTCEVDELSRQGRSARQHGFVNNIGE